MKDDSNDLYSQIMKKLEEKRIKEINHEPEVVKEEISDRFKTSETYKYSEEVERVEQEENFNTEDIRNDSDNSVDFNMEESKAKMIEEFLGDQDFYTEEETPPRNKNRKKYSKNINNKDRDTNEEKERKTKKKSKKNKELDPAVCDVKDVRKTRKLLRSVVIIQLLLLSVLLYLLYNKIFYTKTEISNNTSLNGEISKEIFLMEGNIEIPSIELDDRIYERNEKLTNISITLFKSSNGINRLGNTTIIGPTTEKNKSFANLDKVKVDDKIIITLEKQDPVEYRVIETKEVDKTDLETLVSSEKIEITLIAHTKDENKRLVVKAEVENSQLPEQPKEKNNYKVTTDQLNVRPKPSFNNVPLTSLNTGDIVEVISKKDEWYEIKHEGKSAYVSAEYLKKVSASTKPTGPVIQDPEKQLETLKTLYESLP